MLAFLSAVAGAGSIDTERLKLIPARMQEFVDDGSISGAVCLVAHRGKVVALDAVGFSDIEDRKPMRADAIVQIMSQTKSFIGVAAIDTGFPRQGEHSVGVARQYCGQIGKHDNRQAAVSLSVSTCGASLPIAWRLYLPELWCQDSARRQRAGVPEGIEFQTKPEIAVQQIRKALEQRVAAGVVLADAGYGNGTPFRTALTQLGLSYMVGIESSTTVWEPGQ